MTIIYLRRMYAPAVPVTASDIVSDAFNLGVLSCVLVACHGPTIVHAPTSQSPPPALTLRQISSASDVILEIRLTNIESDKNVWINHHPGIEECGSGGRFAEVQ